MPRFAQRTFFLKWPIVQFMATSFFLCARDVSGGVLPFIPSKVGVAGNALAYVNASSGDRLLGLGVLPDGTRQSVFNEDFGDTGLLETSKTTGGLADAQPNTFQIKAKATVTAAAGIAILPWVSSLGAGGMGIFAAGGGGSVSVTQLGQARDVAAVYDVVASGAALFTNPNDDDGYAYFIRAYGNINVAVNGQNIPLQNGVASGFSVGSPAISFSGLAAAAEEQYHNGEPVVSGPPVTAIGASFTFGSNFRSSNMANSLASMSPSGPLFGESPDFPVPLLHLPAVDQVGESFRLIVPLADGSGTSSLVFAGPSGGQENPAIANLNGLPVATLNSSSLMFSFHTDGPKFASFIIPGPLANGDSSFTIHFGDVTQTFAIGAMIDFTTFVPGGISGFDLSGFSPSLELAQDGAPPFIWGSTYASGGGANVVISVVPEPSSFALGAIGLMGLAGSRSIARRFGAGVRRRKV